MISVLTSNYRLFHAFSRLRCVFCSFVTKDVNSEIPRLKVCCVYSVILHFVVETSCIDRQTFLPDADVLVIG